MLKLKALIIFLFCWLIGNTSFAQLTVNTGLTPAQLVQNVLLGSGVTATNITYTGAPNAIGSFNGSSSNIGFTAGVLMTSGDAVNAIGPNNQSGVSTSNNTSSDPDLDLIMAPTSSFDASIIEFDFIATSDTVKFRYVFGSDEYMEYVSSTPGAGINDGFGLFVSGPGISGPYSNNSQNVAIIPGTGIPGLPVTMFNLNLNSNGVYYFDNGDGNGSGTAPDGLTVQYDGFTKPLTATAILQCGQQYHIKIAIGDGGDDIIDSGLFLEAGSFTIPSNSLTFSATSTLAGQPAQIDTVIYEGCGSVKIDLVRSGCNLTSAYNMPLVISGTATNGVDYTSLSTVNFPANVANASFVINSIPDLLTEGNETLTITFPGGKTITIIIIDSPPLKVNLPKDTIIYCTLPNFSISANPTGGVAIGGYTYSWVNAASTNNTIFVNPLLPTSYYLTVTDTCGNVAKDTIKVTVSPYLPMQMTLNNDTSICEGRSLLLDANVLNGAPGFTYTWSPNITSTDNAMITPPVSANYTVTVTDVCGNTITDDVNVTVIPNNAFFVSSFISNQQAAFTNLSSGSAVSYVWNFGDGTLNSTSSLRDPTHTYQTTGSFTIMLISTNSLGCSDTAYQTIEIYPDFFFYYPNAFTPNGNQNNDVYKGYGVGIRTYSMKVFNRWGEKLFETNDINTGWSGYYNGILSESGVYVVKFDVTGYKELDKREIVTHLTLLH